MTFPAEPPSANFRQSNDHPLQVEGLNLSFSEYETAFLSSWNVQEQTKQLWYERPPLRCLPSYLTSVNLQW